MPPTSLTPSAGRMAKLKQLMPAVLALQLLVLLLVTLVEREIRDVEIDWKLRGSSCATCT